MLEKNPHARYANLKEMGLAWEQAVLDPNAFADTIVPIPVQAPLDLAADLPAGDGLDTVF